MENKYFINGKSYLLAELFSDDIKIIIPDLQRDYCWGTTEFLVEKFINSLLDLFDNNKNEVTNLGLIYGYESPKTHIQLCDGQQRITTLYLLLGMLNKKSDNAFKKYLLTSTNNENRLQYAIRESTLYFLEDLTKYYFKGNTIGNIDDIKNQIWYFKDYDLDPSIQSMLKALKTIEEKVRKDNYDDFGNFILNNLSFLYIDLENRKNGEETFVVINITGEPLSTTENLKPQLITKQSIEKQEECSYKWEEWENYFWLHRGENDTADNGLKEFFRWITLLNLNRKDKDERLEFERILDFEITQDEDPKEFNFSTVLNSVSFEDINSYFEIVKLLFSSKELFGDDKYKALLSPKTNGNKPIELFRLLPVIAYCKKFQKTTKRNTLRVSHFFSNISKINNNIKDLLPKAIDIINLLPDEDIASMRNIEDGISKQILTKEEERKFELYTDSKYNREDLEKRFWKEENHPIWNGEILPLICWSESNKTFNVDLFDSYSKVFNRLFHDDMEYPELDITRRALLTIDLKYYPKIFRGYIKYSFCYHYADWQKLIKENEIEFGNFIKQISSKADDSKVLYSFQEQMIKHSEKKYKDKLEYFVKNKELLNYCEQKNVQWDEHRETWLLIPQINATKYVVLETFMLFIKLKRSNENYLKNWNIGFYDQEGSCVVLNNKNDKTAIDLFYNENRKYQLKLFNRNDGQTKNKYKELSNNIGLSWNNEKKRYLSNEMNKTQLLSLLKKIINQMSV